MSRSSWFKSTKVLFVSLAVTLTACSKDFVASSQKAASTINDGLGCTNYRSHFMDALYVFIDTENEKPDVDQLKQGLREVLEKNTKTRGSTELKNAILEMVDQVVAASAQQEFSAKELLRFLIQLEMGNQSTTLHQKLGAELQASVVKVGALAKALDVVCNQPVPVPAPDLDHDQQGAGRNDLPLPLFGAYYSMATAYQSCQSVTLPEIGANTPDVEGVRKGQDIGGGFQREYASVPDIVRTHYYVQRQSYPVSCFDLSKRPLVYDFGGEPKIEGQGLNFFVNSGPGGSALGLDCSAFISSALAVAGLR